MSLVLEAALGDLGTVITFESMNHILQEAETGLLDEYSTLPPEIMPEVTDTILEWVAEQA